MCIGNCFFLFPVDVIAVAGDDKKIDYKNDDVDSFEFTHTLVVIGFVPAGLFPSCIAGCCAWFICWFDDYKLYISIYQIFRDILACRIMIDLANE
jgi:hypothetical protein